MTLESEEPTGRSLILKTDFSSMQLKEKISYHQLVSVRDVVEMLLNGTHKAQF